MAMTTTTAACIYRTQNHHSATVYSYTTSPFNRFLFHPILSPNWLHSLSFPLLILHNIWAHFFSLRSYNRFDLVFGFSSLFFLFFANKSNKRKLETERHIGAEIEWVICFVGTFAHSHSYSHSRWRTIQLMCVLCVSANHICFISSQTHWWITSTSDTYDCNYYLKLWNFTT